MHAFILTCKIDFFIIIFLIESKLGIMETNRIVCSIVEERKGGRNFVDELNGLQLWFLF